MLRLVDFVERDTDHITFKSVEIPDGGMAYVVYDTSTGNIDLMEDYVSWRVEATTEIEGVTLEDDERAYKINDSNIYPTYLDGVTNYTSLNPRLFKTMTYIEYMILNDALMRIDTVRKRLPNPGFSVSTQNSVGQNGAVSFAGGYEKKFSIDELRQMIEGSIIEINWTSPMTEFWPMFLSLDQEKQPNPYIRNHGIPFDMVDLVVQGVVLRALVAWGLMEIDLSFSASDSGLQINFDRVSHVKNWHDSLLQNYVSQKSNFKMNYASFTGVGLGTIPWSAFGNLLSAGFNNVSYGGQLAISSVTGWSIRGNTPL